MSPSPSDVSAIQDTRSLVRHSLPYTKGRVLDLGAGNAKYKNIILPQAETYIALDAYEGAAIDVVADIEHTPFPDSSFDTIYCTQVLEHVSRPWKAVSEMNRLLAPGGVCVISAPFLEPYHADPNDYFRYTVTGLESLCLEQGLEVVESGSYGRVYSVLVSFLRRRYFDTYAKPKPFTWRLVRALVSLGQKLDRLTRNKIIYANSYVIARKPTSASA